MKNKIEFGYGAKSLSLTPLEYEFKNSKNYYDSNWLKIKLEIYHKQNKYSVIDPFILTAELPKLRTWLDSIDELRENNTFEFLESGIEVSYNCLDSEFIFILSWNLHPLGLDYYTSTKEEYVIKFKKEELNLNKIKRQINVVMENFPEIKL